MAAQSSQFLNLPNELLWKIAENLPMQSVAQLGGTCRGLRVLFHDEKLWKTIAIRNRVFSAWDMGDWRQQCIAHFCFFSWSVGKEKAIENLLDYLMQEKIGSPPPWNRRHIIFAGPKGCGKSRTALALARYLGREMITVNLAYQDKYELFGVPPVYAGAHEGVIGRALIDKKPRLLLIKNITHDKAVAKEIFITLMNNKHVDRKGRPHEIAHCIWVLSATKKSLFDYVDNILWISSPRINFESLHRQDYSQLCQLALEELRKTWAKACRLEWTSAYQLSLCRDYPGGKKNHRDFKRYVERRVSDAVCEQMRKLGKRPTKIILG